MRLLHVIAAMDPKQGGVSQAVLSMIKGLSALNISSEVVSLDDPNLFFLSEPANSFIHPLGPGKSPWCYSPDLIPWLLKNSSRFDCIIIHGLWLFPGYATSKALSIMKDESASGTNTKRILPKICIMPHGMLDPYFQDAKQRKFKALRNYIYWKVIESAVVNSSNKVLFTSMEECLLAQKTFSPYRPKAEEVVGLGIAEPPQNSKHLEATFREKFKKIGKSPYLLFLSRIHEKKGLDLLVEVYHSLLIQSSETQVKFSHFEFPKLVIAGPGIDTTYGKKIRHIVDSDPLLSSKIIFTGMITGDSKWGAFYGCEAFVLPSYQENFGIAVVEAMACEKPVLISDKINIWREISDAGAGLVAQPSFDEIKKLLQTWLESGQEHKDLMSQQAGRLFQKSFAMESAAKRLAKALDFVN